MFDFKNLTEYEVSTMLCNGLNPLTGTRFNKNEAAEITKIIKVIHSAIQNYEIDFDPVYVFIPGMDARVKIVKKTSIKPFSEKISEAIAISIRQRSNKLSAVNIQISILHFIADEGLVEQIEGSYYATTLGESCGIFNTRAKKGYNKVMYSEYMQAYIIRKLPQILYFELFYKYQNNHNNKNLINSIEPLTIEEQQFISKYRSLSENNKKLIDTTISTLSKTDVAQNKSKHII